MDVLPQDLMKYRSCYIRALQSLWNLTGSDAIITNTIARLRDFTTSCDKSSIPLVSKGLGSDWRQNCDAIITNTIARLRDFTTSCDKSSIPLVNKGLGSDWRQNCTKQVFIRFAWISCHDVKIGQTYLSWNMWKCILVCARKRSKYYSRCM